MNKSIWVIEKTHLFNCTDAYIQNKNTVLLYASRDTECKYDKIIHKDN